MADELVQKKESWVESTRSYLAEIRAEMRRVTWPSRAKVESTTIVVILSVFGFSLFFYVVDASINNTVVAAYHALEK